MPTLEDLIALETAVWQALVEGDPAADASLLADDFVGVYPTGFSNRDEHAGQLADGPSVVTFELHDARVLVLAEDSALLSYRADYTRPTPTGAPAPTTMYISSLWCHRDGRWLNVFSQDTPAVS